MGRTQVARIIAISILPLFITGCPDNGGGGSDSSSSDTTPPAVSATQPAADATEVAADTSITADFSEVMDTDSFTTTTFTLSTGGNAVAGTVGHSATTATFNPSADLAFNTTYTAKITSGVKDAAGNPMAADYSWSFTTGHDTTPPTVLSTNPVNNAADVVLNSSINAVFSEAMDPSTLSPSSFTVAGGGSLVTGTVVAAGSAATFTPAGNLAPSTVYTATLTTGAKDLAGNPLAADYTWQFTSGGAQDLTPPTVISTTPVNNATNLPLSTGISATFSEAMDPATLTTATFIVSNGSPISGSIGYSGTMATFTPASALTLGSNYTATITTGAKDLAGNPLASNYIWQFSMLAKPDLCVKPGGGDGCYAKINDALAAANSGDIIGVAAGTYTESVVINKTVTLEGGWDLAFTVLDPAVNVTTIQPLDATFSVVDIEGVNGNTSAVAPTLDGFTITGGNADLGFNHGGGMRVRDSDAIVRNNIITNNTAYLFGGGVWVQRGAPTFENNRIENNTLDTNGGQGAGIELENTQATLIGNTIDSNMVPASNGNGGGVAIVGGGPVTVRGGQISNNSPGTACAGEGGGLYANSSTVTVDGVRVENNCADSVNGGGAGLAFVASPFTITSSVVANNTTADAGGLLADNTSPGVVVNNTIANNNGQGINTASPLTIANTIITGQTTGVYLTAAVTVSDRFNDFWNNGTNTVGFSLDPSDLTVDPLFSSDYHLTAPSPMLDAGTHGPVLKAGSATETVDIPAADLDGESRAMIGPSGLYKVDIGADEYTGTAQRIVDLDTGGADLTVIGPGGISGSLTNAETNDWIGFSVLGDDVNGDGRADLVVAAEDFVIDPNNAPFATGRLFGLFNNSTRKTGTIDLLDTDPNLTIDSQLTLQHIGSAMASGDLNGDGNRDLIAGSFQDDGGGGGNVWPTVFVFWGGSSLTGSRLLDGAHPADFALQAPGQDFFAFSAKNALTTGDLNADGKADLIVGDGLEDDGATADTGAVFVMFGGAGLTGLHDLGTTAADYTLYGPAAAAELQAAAIGRINTGTQNDLVARTATTAHVIFGPIVAGARHLGTTPADITITGLTAGGAAVLDFTGDGQDDLILGSGDKVYILPGPLAAGSYAIGTVLNLVTLTGAADAVAKDEVFAVGNVVGDSKLDLIIGSPTLKRAFVIAGGTSLSGTVTVADAAATLVKSATVKNLGKDVAAGDLDGDGRPDLIVGSHGQDVLSHPADFQDAGIVYVTYGK